MSFAAVGGAKTASAQQISGQPSNAGRIDVHHHLKLIPGLA
jgi:hypothetical protein